MYTSLPFPVPHHCCPNQDGAGKLTARALCSGHKVLEFKFPGHPAPPLELLVRICNAVQNWLAA